MCSVLTKVCIFISLSPNPTVSIPHPPLHPNSPHLPIRPISQHVPLLTNAVFAQALMRSPEVLQFLQQRQAVTQAVTQAAQQQALLEAQQQADFSVGEVEEDANS